MVKRRDAKGGEWVIHMQCYGRRAVLLLSFLLPVIDVIINDKQHYTRRKGSCASCMCKKK